MLKLPDIIELIKVNQTPAWTLYAKATPYATTKEYKGVFAPEDNEEESIERAIKRLEEHTAFLKNETVDHYIIELKFKKKSNGSSVLTYKFVLNESAANNSQPQNQSLNGMSSPEGYITLGQLEAIQKTERALGKVEMKEALLARDRADFERYKQDEKAKIEEDRKYFNSDAQKAAKGFWILGKYVFGLVTDNAPPALGDVKIKEKTNDFPDEHDEDNNEYTEKEKVCAEIAEIIDQNYTDVEDVKKLLWMNKEFIKQQKEPKQTTITTTEETKEENNNNTKTTENE